MVHLSSRKTPEAFIRDPGGSKFASKYNLTRLVYYETFANPAEAIDREKRLKRWKREWKIELVEKSNPNWAELTAF